MLSLYHLNRLKFTSWIKCGFNYFEMPVSCARHLSYFCGVYSNLAPSSSVFSSVSTRRFLAGYLSRCDPVNLTFLISSRGALFAGTVFLRNLQHCLGEPHFTYDSYRTHAADQYIEPYRHTQSWTPLHCSWIISAAVAGSTWC